ncbi:MAG: TraB/GumN family protein [Salibacteraceae bacterium]
MIRIVFSLIGILLLPVFGAAQDFNSLLWKVSGNGLSQPSYLYGTVHIQDQRAFMMGDSVMLALLRCEVMAGELDILKVKQNASAMAPALLLPDSVSLEDLYSEEEYKRVKKAAKKSLGIMSFMVNKIKPIFTYSMMSEANLPKDKSEVLDQYLQEQANENGLQVLGLETLEEQMSALNALSLEEQAALLLEYVDHPTDERAYYNDLVTTYARQDLDSLQRMYENYDGQSSDMDSALVVGRNLIMARRMARLIQNKRAFVAVGALHLPGAQGLIQLLRADGYVVEPVYSVYTPEGEDRRPVKIKSVQGGFLASFPIGPTYAPLPGWENALEHSYRWSGRDYSATFTWSIEKGQLNGVVDKPKETTSKSVTVADLSAKESIYTERGQAVREIVWSSEGKNYLLKITGNTSSPIVENWIANFQLL